MAKSKGKILPLFQRSSSEKEAHSSAECSPACPPEATAQSACEINIRCTQPESSGHMKVTLEYSGDVALASYLIRHAQGVVDSQLSES